MKRILIVMFLILSLTFTACSKKVETEPQKNELTKTEEQFKTGNNKANEEKVKAPDFDLKTLSGKKIKLSSLKGKAVVVNFFATWCPPCKAELPGFISTQEKYKDKDVEFLFVDVMEKKAAVEKFLKERNFNIDPLMDEDGAVFGRDYGVTGIPRTIIVDKEGYVAVDHMGFMDEGSLEAAIKKAME